MSDNFANGPDLPSDLMDEVLKLLASSDAPSLASLIERRREELGLSTKAASEILSMTRTSYERLVTGALQKLDVLTALKLAHFLDVSIEQVMKLVAASVMPAEDYKTVERVKEASFIVRNFDVARLRKLGFIESMDYGHIRDRITHYFGLNSLYEYGTEMAAVLYHRSNTRVEDKMKAFWIMSAVQQFQRVQNPNPFDMRQVEKLVTQIRRYTRQERGGMLTVMRALYEAGVTVIMQKALPSTAVQGGTFIINKKPCIVITDHFKSYPRLWFTLLHELGHVLFHLDKLAIIKYHLTEGVEDLFLLEEQANQFADELLLPRQKYEYIKNYINVETFVNSYAAQNNVHPSIIYYRYAMELSEKQDKTGWQFYSRFMPKSDVCTAGLSRAPWLTLDTSLAAEGDAVRTILAPTSQNTPQPVA